MDLTVRDLIQRVLERNESVQERMLELEINRQKYKAEKGIFEPEAVGSAERVSNTRQNNAQERASSGGTPLLSERNNLYNAGLESLLPTGAKVRLGYTLRDLRNNYQTGIYAASGFTNGEYESFVGANLVQPLLKNAGLDVNLANIRLAAMSSDIAFHEYRRQLMVIVSTAEAAYWNLYLAQEQLLFFKDSVALAETLLNDNRERLKAGKGAELEVLESQSGLALRKSKQAEARQKYFDAVNRLTSLYSESVITTNRLVIAIEEPEVQTAAYSFFSGWQTAFDWNPDYLIQRRRLLSENIRLAYAKNQRLPQLDLKASYGLNGLGVSPSDSMDQLETRGFPSWSVGMEMRIPLGGGIKTRSELNAAKLRQRQALLGLKELETQIASALDTALQKASSARDSVASYQTVVEFNRNLLETQLARLKVGKVESRKVLEVEADLFEARNALADAKVQHQRALLEQELVQGSLLKSRHLELTQRELQERTSQLVRGASISDEQFHSFVKDLQLAYWLKSPPMDAAAEDKARQLLRDKESELEVRPAPTRFMTNDEYEKARRVLQEQLPAPQPTPIR